MKWAHLITSLEGGGTENFLFQILAHSPPQHQHRVFYLGREGFTGKKIRQLGLSVERTRPWAFYTDLKREKPDVLHTSLYWGNQFGRLLGRAARVPLIISSQRSIEMWQKPWHRILDRWTLPHCHAIAYNSDAARRVIEARLRPSAHRPTFFKVQNGIDFGVYTSRDRQAAERLYSLPSEAVVGGTLMRLHAEKGAEKIPLFARALLQKHPSLILLIGGQGPMEASLKKETAALGDRIRWVGWQDEAAQFLSALDFFWLLSREESFSQALLEASGARLPWLAPDVGGVRELADAGAAGVLYPAKDLASAVTQAGQIVSHLDQYRAQAEAAVPRLQNRFDLSTMANTFYTIVESQQLRR